MSANEFNKMSRTIASFFARSHVPNAILIAFISMVDITENVQNDSFDQSESAIRSVPISRFHARIRSMCKSPPFSGLYVYCKPRRIHSPIKFAS